jgi:hypothetical protein
LHKRAKPLIATLALVLLCCAGCASDAEEPKPAAPPSEPPPVEVPCADDEQRLPDGRCLFAGITADGCGQVLDHDGERGCTAGLPAEPCPAGTLAIVGESACHEIAPCGDGTWGDIVTDIDTQHVDVSYAGGNSDGTVAQPWTTIGAAVGAAVDGAQIAIAAGRYVEDVRIDDRSLRLIGRCPSMVEWVGAGVAPATLTVQLAAASGTRIVGLQIGGPRVAVAISGAADVTLEGVWLHGASRGIEAMGNGGSTSVVLREALVEDNGDVELLIFQSALTLERSLIRPTRADGRAINVESHSETAPATATIRQAVLEGGALGLVVIGGAAQLEDSAVRWTTDRAINAQVDTNRWVASDVTLDRVVVEQIEGNGVYVGGSSLSAAAFTVRDVVSKEPGVDGRGLSIESDAVTGERSTIALDRVLLEHCDQAGIVARGSVLRVNGLAVRDVGHPDTMLSGRGMSIEDDLRIGLSSVLELEQSWLARTREAALLVTGTEARIRDVVIEATAPNASDLFGDGALLTLGLSAPSSGVLDNVRVDGSARAGVALVGASATVTGSKMTCNGLNLTVDAYGGIASQLSDGGGNVCGCESEVPCKATSAGLEPPTTL